MCSVFLMGNWIKCNTYRTIISLDLAQSTFSFRRFLLSPDEPSFVSFKDLTYPFLVQLCMQRWLKDFYKKVKNARLFYLRWCSLDFTRKLSTADQPWSLNFFENKGENHSSPDVMLLRSRRPKAEASVRFRKEHSPETVLLRLISNIGGAFVSDRVTVLVSIF